MTTKRILCIGGSGQLGRYVTKTLQPYLITNIDYNHCENSKINILLKKNLSTSENNKEVIAKLKNNHSSIKYDSIIVTAGGWTQGSIKDDDYLTKTNNMIDVNLIPSLLGAHLATKYLS